MLVHSHQKAPGRPDTDSLAARPIVFSGMGPPAECVSCVWNGRRGRVVRPAPRGTVAPRRL
ncbi:hypothetical protein Sm713_00890 [Streptomyces sp. TS71-3]|nr:hypothetical protein Sm713_00890 [Streptomyces sp. TS71-3]